MMKEDQEQVEKEMSEIEGIDKMIRTRIGRDGVKIIDE
jgi:hypothetical protein